VDFSGNPPSGASRASRLSVQRRAAQKSAAGVVKTWAQIPVAAPMAFPDTGGDRPDGKVSGELIRGHHGSAVSKPSDAPLSAIRRAAETRL
jgi:hypothetical protein